MNYTRSSRDYRCWKSRYNSLLLCRHSAANVVIVKYSLSDRAPSLGFSCSKFLKRGMVQTAQVRRIE